MAQGFSKGIIYLDRQRIGFYGSNKWSEAVYLNLESSVVWDLEIVDIERLEELIGNFLKLHQINPAPSLLFISKNVYFEKTLLSKEGDFYKEAKRFIGSLPFRQTIHRLFISEKEVRIVALNHSFYQGIEKIFTKFGFIIEGVVPFSDDFDSQKGKMAIKQYSSFRKRSLLKTDKHLAMPDLKTKRSIFAFIERHKILIPLFVLIWLFLLFLLLYMVLEMGGNLIDKISQPRGLDMTKGTVLSQAHRPFFFSLIELF